LTPEEEGGAVDTQAGSHPFQTTFTVDLNQEADTSDQAPRPEVDPAELSKDLKFKLPPGLIGNPIPIPQCTVGQFLHIVNFEERHNGKGHSVSENECPSQTAVGMVTINIFEPSILGYFPFTVPLFNLEPHTGEPARFGFYLPLAELGIFI